MATTPPITSIDPSYPSGDRFSVSVSVRECHLAKAVLMRSPTKNVGGDASERREVAAQFGRRIKTRESMLVPSTGVLLEGPTFLSATREPCIDRVGKE